MAFQSKPRAQPIILDKAPWHSGGDCHCARPLHTGRCYAGSEACDRCGHLQGRKKWMEIPRRGW